MAKISIFLNTNEQVYGYRLHISRGSFLWYTVHMFGKEREKNVHVMARPFMEWFATTADTSQRREKAAHVMRQAKQAVADLAAWRTTPQSAPWHCEGPTVADHVARMLVTLFAITEGEGLAHVEEFVREKDLGLDIQAMVHVLRTNERFLTAFAIIHDCAKPETAFFDAEPDTRGAAEGFIQHGLRGERKMTEAERIRYDKLFRAYAAAHPILPTHAVMGSFYDAYGIAVHYDRHDAVAASPACADTRSAVAQAMTLPLSEQKMLAELVRYHIDSIHAFNDRADAKAYEILAARAGRAGLNVEVFLDLALAVLFLDAVAGSVHYEQGAYRAQTQLVVHMLRAEREAVPKRHADREFARDQAAKNEYKAMLANAGLDGESVFALLGTPIGPVRGDVMRRVQAAIDDPSAPLDFGAHTDELRRRIARVRE